MISVSWKHDKNTTITTLQKKYIINHSWRLRYNKINGLNEKPVYLVGLEEGQSDRYIKIWFLYSRDVEDILLITELTEHDKWFKFLGYWVPYIYAYKYLTYKGKKTIIREQ
jgi:hypothetical protein